jgi:hypothetical protein
MGPTELLYSRMQYCSNCKLDLLEDYEMNFEDCGLSFKILKQSRKVQDIMSNIDCIDIILCLSI